MAYFADTIAALATPVGTSALAIVRVSGPQVDQLVEAVFHASPLPRQVARGDYCDRTGFLVDDVLYAVFRGPNSYTGENVLEITCHGNPFITRKILDDVHARGCRPAEPGEFTKRSFLNGCMDLSQAEAVIDLIRARSDRALAAANQQLRGALGRHLQPMNRQLLELLARVEAYIDFPDEDLPPEDRSSLLHGTERLLADTKRLLATNHYGDILRDGVKTVILGAPNSGKSSLLNRLLGRERALVSSEPGTTRDYLEEIITLGPHCIRLIDTAGLNPTPAPLEQRGIEKTLERADDADLILLVLDATQPAPVLPDAVSARLATHNTLVVVNKTDLVPAGPYPSPPAGLSTLKISALTGFGCDELGTAISRYADSFRVEQGEDLIAVNARHAHALRQAAESLETALGNLSAGGQADELLASELRNVLRCYGEISGQVDNEQVLDELFSNFCIGK